MDISVRRLGNGDEATLVGIVLRHKLRSIDCEYASRLLRNPLNFLLVAELAQHPVGFAWGYLLQRLDRNNHQLFVYEVDVLPSARRRGAGTALMRFVSAYTKEHNLTEAFVFTEPDNLAANNLYQKTGAIRTQGLSTMFIYEGSAP